MLLAGTKIDGQCAPMLLRAASKAVFLLIITADLRCVRSPSFLVRLGGRSERGRHTTATSLSQPGSWSRTYAHQINDDATQTREYSQNELYKTVEVDKLIEGGCKRSC